MDFYETESLAGAKIPPGHCHNYQAQCLGMFVL